MTERGAASVAVLGLVAVVLAAIHLLVALANDAVLRAETNTAADCAALAGAQVLAAGGDTESVMSTARRIARENGATVRTATVGHDRIDVKVSRTSGASIAYARGAAEVVDGP